MELYDDTYQEKKKGIKVTTIIVIFIAILIILGGVIVYAIIYLRGNTVTTKVDDVKMNDITEMLLFDESTGETKIYVPIRKIASYFGYKDYTGDYRELSEDESKCYVQCENEIAMFTQDSNVLFKIRKDSDYEYINLSENVVKKEGEWYTTSDGIEKAFNVIFSYDSTKKNIEIYTMPYLVKFYGDNLKNAGYIETSSEFTDQKSIFENMLIVKSENGKYGVVEASTGKEILETKYDKIQYLPKTKDFLIQSNNKYGIMTKNQTVKVRSIYEKIEIMDNDKGLYLVTQNGFKGVIDTDGKIIIPAEYTQIGLESIDRFKTNGVQSKYILVDNLIPIKKDNLWGFYNVKGEKVTEFKYTQIGCTSSKVANSEGVLVIPKYKCIIVSKDNKYNIMDKSGNEKLETFILDSVYLKSNSSGTIKYYMTFDEQKQTRDIEETLASYGMKEEE